MLGKGIEMLRAIDIPIADSICPNVQLFRSHTHLGQCCGPGTTKNKTSYDYVIEVSEFVVNNSERNLMNIILHELIHTCRDTSAHDRKWKHYASIANAEYGYDIKRTIGDYTPGDIENLRRNKPVRERKYAVECPSCGWVWKRKTLSKLIVQPEEYTCSKCKCELRRIA